MTPSRLFPLLLAALMGGLVVRWGIPTPVLADVDSGPRYVAVAGPYQEGVSLLYVLDQKTRHLAIYEARGGSPSSRELVFVAARNLSLDLLLDGFNDESEMSYRQLQAEFDSRGIALPDSRLPSPSQPPASD